MLPAIVFLRCSEACDNLALALLNYLEEKEYSKVTKKDTKNYERMIKQAKKKRDVTKKNTNGTKQEDFNDLDEISVVNPNRINEQFSFLDSKRTMTDTEVDDEIYLHRRLNISSKMFDAWKRGIGVHHANYHTKFRSSVECLFRK